jgi:hypothetical protein
MERMSCLGSTVQTSDTGVDFVLTKGREVGVFK